MAVAIVEGSVAEFDAMVYGQKHPGTLQFLSNQVASLQQSASQYLTDAGKNFFANAADIYERFNGSEALRVARAAMRKVSHIFQSDEIKPLRNISEIQQAPLKMQRWIMAEPTIRQAWLDQRCDGYSGSYVDMHGGVIGVEHSDWRHVMSGIVEDIVDDDGESNWKTTIYLDEVPAGDVELQLGDKTDVLTAWDLVKMYRQLGKEDPVSPSNNML
jgi:hypothetical protein